MTANQAMADPARRKVRSKTFYVQKTSNDMGKTDLSLVGREGNAGSLFFYCNSVTCKIEREHCVYGVDDEFIDVECLECKSRHLEYRFV